MSLQLIYFIISYYFDLCLGLIYKLNFAVDIYIGKNNVRRSQIPRGSGGPLYFSAILGFQFWCNTSCG
jgi:hypothetical protein